MPALAGTAHAVVISTSRDTANLLAPAENPGWNNVAHLSSASAVYLGNDWMLTANHVSDAPVQFSDGRVFNIAPGTDVPINNPGSLALLGAADLRMFRLTADPGLPALQLSTATPGAGATVMMIGAGADRGPNEIGWQVTSNASGGTTWQQVPLPLANAVGFLLLGSSHMRWGYNQVQSGGLTLAENNTIAFTTQFDHVAIPFEAQAVVGDSGGAVFQFVAGSWKLVGIMNAEKLLTGQPSNTVAFGQSTLCGDLFSYHDPIFNLVNHVWQNPQNRFDVSRSGGNNPQDLLQVINQLLGNGSHALLKSPGASDPLVDINGDGFVNPLDALQLINNLLSQPAGDIQPFAGAMPLMRSQVAVVPEPAGAVLAVSGLLVLAWARRRALARRKRCAG